MTKFDYSSMEDMLKKYENDKEMIQQELNTQLGIPHAVLGIIAGYAKIRIGIDLEYLSENPAAIHMIEKNLDKEDWWMLSRNPAAIHLIEKNLDKADWRGLSRNPAAIHLIEKNLDKVCWYGLSRNRAIFKSNKDEIYKILIRI